MSSSRRVFLKSLSRSSLVLSLESILGLATPRWLRAGATPNQKTDPKVNPSEAQDLGVSFLNVARESGLNAKTI
ncbi:MAG: CRTAC1 family protein, partial [Candidatus Sulfotelmatobacter sp.]